MFDGFLRSTYGKKPAPQRLIASNLKFFKIAIWLCSFTYKKKFNKIFKQHLKVKKTLDKDQYRCHHTREEKSALNINTANLFCSTWCMPHVITIIILFFHKRTSLLREKRRFKREKFTLFNQHQQHKNKNYSIKYFKYIFNSLPPSFPLILTHSDKYNIIMHCTSNEYVLREWIRAYTAHVSSIRVKRKMCAFGCVAGNIEYPYCNQ